MKTGMLRSESVAFDGRRLVVDLPNGVSLTRSWHSALVEAARANPGKMAFVWDDFLIRRVGRGTPELHRLRWPDADPLLLHQVNAAGRCAVDADAVNAAGDTGAGLAILAAKMPDSVMHLPKVMRFVEAENSILYRPTAAPPSPQKRATGVSMIINYRDRPELMRACLESVARQHLSAALEVILVDNQSSSSSISQVRSDADRFLGSRASVQHLRYDASYNHSAQNNLAAESAAYSVLLLLNNDATFIDADCAQSIADWSLNTNVVASAPRILGAKGQVVANGVFIRPSEGDHPALIQENETVPLSLALRTGAGAPFSCAAVSRATWNALDGLDARAFPTQYNDADFWLRGLERGMCCIYAGHVAAQHQPGHSELRTREMTASRLDKLRERHPRMSDLAGRDPYFVHLGGVPRFESWIANAKLDGIRAQEKARAIARKFKAVR